MPSQGSTTKKCVFCHAQLYVACKTCKQCKAEQPRKLRLKKKMEKFDQKRDSWVHTHQKNRTTSHIRDEAHMLLEKLHALGVRAVLLLSRPGRKPNACMTEILAPRCHLTETSSTCLQRMKDLFNIVIQGWTPQGSEGHFDEASTGPFESQTGPRIATLDPYTAMSLLDLPVALTSPQKAPTGILTTSTGLLKTPIGQTAALIGPSTHHASPEQQSQNLGKVTHSHGPPAASSVHLEKDTSSIDIKTETEDIESSSSHSANNSAFPMLLVAVTDTGFVGDIKGDWEAREEAGHRVEKEKGRKMRDIEPASAPIHKCIKEESIEAMCGGPPSVSPSAPVESNYKSIDATISGQEEAELQVMKLDARISQMTKASNMTLSSDMAEAQPLRPPTNCDLDAMDFDQLRREKMKMQIKVLRLQEDYYIQKMAQLKI